MNEGGGLVYGGVDVDLTAWTPPHDMPAGVHGTGYSCCRGCPGVSSPRCCAYRPPAAVFVAATHTPRRRWPWRRKDTR
jgi:hypothetical protein